MPSSAPRSLSQTPSEKDLGALTSRVLSGVWRESLPAEGPPLETLSLITPLLYATGSAALGWWRISRDVQSPTSNVQGPVAAHRHETDIGPWALLHDAYRRSRLNAVIHEHELKHILSLLRAAGIEPILVKGWAIARRYPDRALRPYGDFDLCIRPDQFAQAESALKCLETIDGYYVDLHDGFATLDSVRNLECADSSALSRVETCRDGRSQGARDGLRRQAAEDQSGEARILECADSSALSRVETCRDGRSPEAGDGLRRQAADDQSGDKAPHSKWDELFERSQLIDLGDEKVRVLSDEDHLRVLCIHLMRSGAWRPLWLCDVALMVESRSAEFDWARCLGTDSLTADWVACTIGLAHQLLGADVSGTPVEERAQNLPRWLAPAVLRQWGRARGPSQTRMLLPELLRNLHKPALMFRELNARWDRPVVATFKLRAPLNNFPRAPYLLADMLRRAANLPGQLALMVRDQLSLLRHRHQANDVAMISDF